MSEALDAAFDRFAIVLVRDPVEKKWLCAVVDGEVELLPGGHIVYSGQNRDDAVNYAVRAISEASQGLWPPCGYRQYPEGEADDPELEPSSPVSG